MAKTTQAPAAEKFKTMIGGQALIEGIMMRGPENRSTPPKGQASQVHKNLALHPGHHQFL